MYNLNDWNVLILSVFIFIFLYCFSELNLYLYYQCSVAWSILYTLCLIISVICYLLRVFSTLSAVFPIVSFPSLRKGNLPSWYTGLSESPPLTQNPARFPNTGSVTGFYVGSFSFHCCCFQVGPINLLFAEPFKHFSTTGTTHSELQSLWCMLKKLS